MSLRSVSRIQIKLNAVSILFQQNDLYERFLNLLKMLMGIHCMHNEQDAGVLDYKQPILNHCSSPLLDAHVRDLFTSALVQNILMKRSMICIEWLLQHMHHTFMAR